MNEKIAKRMIEQWGKYPQQDHANRLNISIHTYRNWVKKARKDGVELPDCRKNRTGFSFKNLNLM